ncbi:hypothetical protein ABFS83_14G040000 [Erythranthe nasuta]
MYSSSTSSSPQGSMGSSGGGGGGGNGNGNGGLMRYGSAPSSILNSAVDSVIGATREFSALGAPNHHNPTAHFFPSESAAMANQNDAASRRNSGTSTREELGKLTANTTIGLQPSYGFGGGGGGGSSSLARHSSSPAGFLNQLASVAAVENNNGFSITRGIGSYNAKGVAESGRSRLNPQLSFTGQQSTAANLSRISEDHNNAGPSDNDRRKSSRSYSAASGSGSGSGSGGGYGALGSWDQTHPIIFSVAQPNGAHNIDSQFHFSMSQEMASMDKLLNIPQDSVTCKIRAKRGFATHPRSIAERERRTRISGKLKKLQDLVPNMDKQTSYADMLDLAVQHIKTLQNQVQKLHTELDSCTCGCKKTRDS